MTATILIVDDEENALRNISAFLEPKGYEIITATTLAQARSSLQRGEPDIVLLDVQLPDGYGPDLLCEPVFGQYFPAIMTCHVLVLCFIPTYDRAWFEILLCSNMRDRTNERNVSRETPLKQINHLLERKTAISTHYN